MMPAMMLRVLTLHVIVKQISVHLHLMHQTIPKNTAAQHVQILRIVKPNVLEIVDVRDTVITDVVKLRHGEQLVKVVLTPV